MKIRIKAEGYNILLWLPTSLLKTRILCSILQNGVRKLAKNDENATQEQTKIDTPATIQVETTQQETIRFTRKQQLELYRTLKDIIKTQGHFNLVEVQRDNGEKVLIRI